jgi:hypothetical protein
MLITAQARQVIFDLWGRPILKVYGVKKMPQAFDNIGLAANMATTAARGSQSLVF